MVPTNTHTASESHSPVEAATKPLILVIDPDESTRSVLEVALTRDGFDVWSAGGSAEGMLLLTGRLPDVIVLESDLGGDDGFTFVAQLRGDDRLAKLPVVLLARADDQNVEAMSDVVGVDDFLQKPAFARDVAAMVRLELAQRGHKGDSVFFDSKVLPPEQLLRALLSCPRSGHLFLANGRAEIRFRSGKVIDARFDSRGGDLETVVRSLALTAGEYSLRLEAVDGFAELQCGLREVVELVVPRLQRWGRVVQRSLPLESQLTVEFSRLAGALKAMPDEVNRVVQLFDGFRSVEEVLIDSPINETLTLEVATRLYLMGVLVPAKGHDGELIFQRPMPRLFEPRAAEAEELMQQLFAGTAEIRGPVEEEGVPGEASDWFALSAKANVLDVPEPNGGWTTAPVPETLAEGLSPELARQLDAFHTPMQVEKKDRPADEVVMQGFANREHAAAASATAIEVALMQASETHPALGAEVDEAIDAQRLSARGTQARIETPWMTPVVELAERQATANAPSTVVVAAQESAPLEALTAREDGTSEAQVSPSRIELSPEVSIAEKTTAAPVRIDVRQDRRDSLTEMESAFFEQTNAPRETVLSGEFIAPKSQRRLWPFVVAALVIAALGLILDALSAPREEAPTPAPVPVEVVAPAAAVQVAPVAVEEVVEELAPAAIDISENLTEARKLYEQGQYKKSVTILEQALVDDPSSVAGWNLLGLARYDSMDITGARAAADKVLALEPNNGRVQILLATLHFDANEKDQGRAALEKYLELEPNGQHADEARALLKR